MVLIKKSDPRFYKTFRPVIDRNEVITALQIYFSYTHTALYSEDCFQENNLWYGHELVIPVSHHMHLSGADSTDEVVGRFDKNDNFKNA